MALGAALLLNPLVAAETSPALAADDQSSEWRFSATPYIWLPAIDGKLKYNIPPGAGGSPNVDINSSDFLQGLDFLFMLAGDARKGDWGILTDFVYADLAGDAKIHTITGPGGVIEIPEGLHSETDITVTMWTLAGTYSAYREGHTNLDIFAGFRFVDVSTTLDWRAAGPLDLLPPKGHASESSQLWDAIAGVRGQIGLGGNWFVPYYLDAGGGSSFTWQGITGVGYAFHWGDMTLVWRHLSYDQGDDKFVHRMSLSGPQLGMTMRF
jgi:hypothetical protein